MAKRVVSSAALFANKPTPVELPANAPSKFEGYAVKPRIARHVIKDKKTGEPLRLAKPRNVNITPGGEFNRLYARNMREWVEFIREREKMEYVQNYAQKRAEFEAKKREEAAHREYKRRSSLRRQEFWSGVLNEYKDMKEELRNVKNEFRAKKSQLEKAARVEWLKVLNEDCELFTVSPEDLKYRKYDILNPEFLKRLPRGHTYNLSL